MAQGDSPFCDKCDKCDILKNVVYYADWKQEGAEERVIQAYQRRAFKIHSFLKNNLEYLVDPEFAGFNAALFRDIIEKIYIFHQTYSWPPRTSFPTDLQAFLEKRRSINGQVERHFKKQ